MVGTSGTSAPSNSTVNTESTSSNSGPKMDQSPPAQDDVKRFNESLERRERDQQGKGDQQSGDKDGGQDGSGSRRDDKGQGNSQSEPQSPMQLFGKMNTNQSQPVKPAQPLSPMASDNRLNELAQNLTSRIMVGETSGSTEVRIQLNEAVLPGTEVRISERDGRLVAEFVISNADSSNFLNQRQDDLASRLSKVLQKDVDVITVQDSGAGTNEGDSNRRSSQEYQGDDEEDEDGEDDGL
ncbi:type III secretion HpaP family protein [Thalassospira sp.]|uniref:type III secretion HpaP family protein n=1 Tax=Thalassospira sp. TaxID=1912094 RepID=UPI000C6562DC|nr:type III secretion HpaP family protein [Thalassospira sp.]MBC05412.1 hypothetical protein [Thalassospira sp.]|tara:strand:- start:12469 stop:13185 length:717 start_codon:yes stop_codon:yes gene_type:complete